MATEETAVCRMVNPTSMSMRLRSVFLFGTASLLAQAANGQVSFELIPQQPGLSPRVAISVSVDGQHVTGSASSRAFRWSSLQGLEAIPLPPDCEQAIGWGISGDGSTIVGNVYQNSVRRAFIWDAQSGMTVIGSAAPGWSSALDVSADGRTVVGDYLGESRAFRWTSETGFTTLPGGGSALTINPAGTAMCGTDLTSRNAVRWLNGVATVIPRFPNSDLCYGYALSDDANVVVGISTAVGGNRAFRWAPETGTLPIQAADGRFATSATAISGDGSVIAGRIGGGLGAFVWTESEGVRDLGELLGAAVPPDIQYLNIRDMSGDGRVIVGEARYWDNSSRAFVATIPAPGLASTSAVVLMLWCRRRERSTN